MKPNCQRFAVWSFASALLTALPAGAAVQFTFDYSGTGGGLWSSDAKASLESAANTVSALLINYNAVVPMQVSGSNANTSTLASAGSLFVSTPANSFGSRGEVTEVILSNGTYMLTTDASGTFAGTVDANFFHNWSFTDTVGGGQFDFTSTMIHELTHALGVSSLIAQAGGSSFMNNTFAPFDQFLVNGAGEKLVNPAVGNGTDGKWTTASVGGTGTSPATANTGLYFDGANATAANGGNLVPIYSPNPWEEGSSGSHLDDNFYTGSNARLMNAATLPGPGVRTFSAIEMGLLRDIGYTQLIPEPNTALLGCLVATLAIFGRKRRCGN